MKPRGCTAARQTPVSCTATELEGEQGIAAMDTRRARDTGRAGRAGVGASAGHGKDAGQDELEGATTEPPRRGRGEPTRVLVSGGWLGTHGRAGRSAACLKETSWGARPWQGRWEGAELGPSQGRARAEPGRARRAMRRGGRNRARGAAERKTHEKEEAGRARAEKKSGPRL
jgi:hypothetical protein